MDSSGVSIGGKTLGHCRDPLVSVQLPNSNVDLRRMQYKYSSADLIFPGLTYLCVKLLCHPHEYVLVAKHATLQMNHILRAL